MITLVVFGVSPAVSAWANEVDPWEGFNRKMMAFNDGADKYVLRPIARGYVAVLPQGPRRGISNFLGNLRSPIIIINQLLQGKFRLGGRDAVRFLTNTTVGVVGLFDPATKWGFEEHDEDFGQTFGRWGIPSGPYLVVPIWGPVTIRSGVGDIANVFAHPIRLVKEPAVGWTLVGLWAVDRRAQLLGTESLLTGDRYLFIRDALLQRQEYLINDGMVEEDPFLDDDF